MDHFLYCYRCHLLILILVLISFRTLFALFVIVARIFIVFCGVSLNRLLLFFSFFPKQIRKFIFVGLFIFVSFVSFTNEIMKDILRWKSDAHYIYIYIYM